MASVLFAQEDATPPVAGPAKWVNVVPPTITADPALVHGTFFSKANKTDIGYFVALPRGYDAPDAKNRRFPVIYYLHGGGGNEGRGVQGYPSMKPMLTSADYPAAFFVVVNGGNPNYIDTADSKGGTGFLELVAHIDRTYRTVAAPEGRVMLGHSMGGRGTGRIIFRHPELIGTGVAMSGGHQREKSMSETGAGGRGESKLIDPKDNTWDNATLYAARKEAPKVRLMVVVGNKDANYAPNLEWCAHLAKLKIPHELIVVPDSGHGINMKTHHTERRVWDFIAAGLKPAEKK
ncbi:MAG: prolyl oligopeptidase family serine peptidase [Opitutaceae bacterium]|nr:prolyl oligopeptidase family serine peptidase [Opitutaceae bacterium]